MKRLMGIGLLLLVTSIAAAQDQPRTGRGPGGFGGFGGGATSVLASPEVQKELNLTDEQKKKITDIGDAVRKEMASSFSREDFQKLSEEDRRKRFDEMRKKGEETAKKTLADVAKVLDAKQNERFGQLRLQRDGINAIAQDDVAAKLGLNGDQREEIAKIVQSSRPTGGGGFGPGGTDEERRAAFEKLQKAREKSQSDLLAVLTPEQKAKWESMLGAKFAFPQRGGFGGRGPGGQPGGAARPAPDAK